MDQKRAEAEQLMNAVNNYLQTWAEVLLKHCMFTARRKCTVGYDIYRQSIPVHILLNLMDQLVLGVSWYKIMIPSRCLHRSNLRQRQDHFCLRRATRLQKSRGVPSYFHAFCNSSCNQYDNPHILVVILTKVIQIVRPYQRIVHQVHPPSFQ